MNRPIEKWAIKWLFIYEIKFGEKKNIKQNLKLRDL